MFLMWISSALPEEYNDFRTTWESVSRYQNFVEYLLEWLPMIETHINRRQEDIKSPSAVSAYFAQESSRPRYLQQIKRKNYSTVQCYTCKQLCYTLLKCPNRSSAVIVKAVEKSAALFRAALLVKTANVGIWMADS